MVYRYSRAIQLRNQNSSQWRAVATSDTSVGFRGGTAPLVLPNKVPRFVTTPRTNPPTPMPSTLVFRMVQCNSAVTLLNNLCISYGVVYGARGVGVEDKRDLLRAFVNTWPFHRESETLRRRRENQDALLQTPSSNMNPDPITPCPTGTRTPSNGERKGSSVASIVTNLNGGPMTPEQRSSRDPPSLRRPTRRRSRTSSSGYSQHVNSSVDNGNFIPVQALSTVLTEPDVSSVVLNSALERNLEVDELNRRMQYVATHETFSGYYSPLLLGAFASFSSGFEGINTYSFEQMGFTANGSGTIASWSTRFPWWEGALGMMGFELHQWFAANHVRFLQLANQNPARGLYVPSETQNELVRQTTLRTGLDVAFAIDAVLNSTESWENVSASLLQSQDEIVVGSPPAPRGEHEARMIFENLVRVTLNVRTSCSGRFIRINPQRTRKLEALGTALFAERDALMSDLGIPTEEEAS